MPAARTYRIELKEPALGRGALRSCAGRSRTSPGQLGIHPETMWNWIRQHEADRASAMTG
jgi:hypothetical protein